MLAVVVEVAGVAEVDKGVMVRDLLDVGVEGSLRSVVPRNQVLASGLVS